MTRPFARAAVLVAALIALTAPTAAPARQTGANTTPYPEQFKTNFMKGCMEGSAEPVCRCILDEVERTLTVEQFVDFDKAAEEKRIDSHPLTPWFRGVIQQCVAAKAA